MNNLETTKSFMETLNQNVQFESEKLNNALSSVGIKQNDYSNVVKKIEKQIESADKKFTISFVGTFKTGKSTIINSLLDLKGDARLSSEFDPDTARCTRIIQKGNRDYEAEVDFGNEYPVEKLSWTEAKKYTSQVAIDEENDEFKRRAAKITEVRYYVDSPLLQLCNILDLPGTGTGNHDDHTAVADEKIMESDCIFWVLTTEFEPNLESVKNLEKIRTKMLPIINVWQDEKLGIKGDFSPEEIYEIIKDGYSEYLVNADKPIVYYAKEIDNAQLEGKDIKDEWGRTALIEKVQEINRNINDGDRAIRIKNNLISALDECKNVITEIQDDEKIKKLKEKFKDNKNDLQSQMTKLGQCKRIVKKNINDSARTVADEILDIISNSSESFVRNKMTGVNIRYLYKMFSKKQKDSITKELSDDFKNNFLKFDSGWVGKAAEGYEDEVLSILNGKYIDFIIDLEKEKRKSTDQPLNDNDFTGFIDSISEQIQKDFMSKTIKIVSGAVTTIVLACIPEMLLIDTILSFVSLGKGIGGFADDSKLRSRTDMIVIQSKAQIRQQRFTLVDKLKERGDALNDRFYEEVESSLKKEKESIDRELEKFNEISECLESFETFIINAKKEIGITFV